MATFTAVLPDGTLATQNSNTKVYTFAVAQKLTENGVQSTEWQAPSFASSRELAEKALVALQSRFFQARNNGYFDGSLFQIVEVIA